MIKVYKYGLLAPIENAHLVREQILAAHRYRNTLVEIERGRRAAVRSLHASVGNTVQLEAAVKDADVAVTEALRILKGARASTRSRSETAEMREAVKTAKAKKFQAVNQLREHLRNLREDPRVVSETERIENLAMQLKKNARAYCGAYWGTYLLIEAAADQMRKSMPLYDGEKPNDPAFVRWDRQGTIGVQIQKGEDACEFEKGDDTRLRITAGMPIDNKPRKVGRNAERARTLWFRVGSDESRNPIWAKFPMILHRPFPEGARVKSAAIHLKRHGNREEWTVTFTLDIPEQEASTRMGQCVIDVGWRKMGEEIRVATWLGSDGSKGEIRLPARLMTALEKPSQLQSIRDEKFNNIRKFLLQHLVNAPEWMKGRTKTLSQWRSIGKLAALVIYWRNNRYEGDEEVYKALEAWRYDDYHLWAWQSGTGRSSLRWRREVYRVAAARLAEHYQTLGIEDFDLRSMAKRTSSESEKTDIKAVRHNRQRASVSELREVLCEAFKSRGGEVVKLDAAFTTRVCHVCKKMCNFDSAAMIYHGCEFCGAEPWDQDENACENMMELIRAHVNKTNDVDISLNVQIKGGRFARKKAEKAAKNTTV